MSRRFEELDWQRTPFGEISLRRRHDPVTGTPVHEVKLGDEFLMSSLFTAGEVELARLALALVARRDELDVVVGGLGLGFTAHAVLEDARVRQMLVVEALAPVIDWHRRGLVPGGRQLATGSRSRLVEGDFFALCAGAEGFDPERAGRQFDVIALDIDHSPRHVLRAENASLYTTTGLLGLARWLRAGGVFALWSNDEPDAAFLDVMSTVFPDARAHVVAFANPLQGRTATNTVYCGTVATAGAPERSA